MAAVSEIAERLEKTRERSARYFNFQINVICLLFRGVEENRRSDI